MSINVILLPTRVARWGTDMCTTRSNEGPGIGVKLLTEAETFEVEQGAPFELPGYVFFPGKAVL